MATEITLYINPTPNFDVTAEQLAAVRDEAVRRVREEFPEAEVNSFIKDSLRSFTYWDDEDGCFTTGHLEMLINEAIREAWEQVVRG